jgi:hypothetical protein
MSSSPSWYPTAEETAQEMRVLGQMILDAMDDPNLFLNHFQPAFSWRPHRVPIKVIFGLPLTAEETILFQESTGRSVPFKHWLNEAWLLVGRRSGKSSIFALIAVCVATFYDYRRYLRPGERPAVLILARTQAQADTILGYCAGLFAETPMLQPKVVKQRARSLDLDNGVRIAVHVSNFASIRGSTAVCVLCDEISFWADPKSRNPAREILAAVRKNIGTIPSGLILCASSIRARVGVSYDAFMQHHGNNNSNVMVWRSPTIAMNLSYRLETVQAAYDADHADAAAEYGSEWMDSVDGFLSEAVISAAFDRGRVSSVQSPNHVYHAYVDVSGGIADAAVICVGHQEAGRIIIDRIEIAKAPHNPEVVAQQFADVLSTFSLSRVTGDQYAGLWPAASYARHGISYIEAQKNKSQIYEECEVLFTSHRIELPENEQLETELRQLESRPTSTGKKIDHPPGAHDDCANAALGCAWLINQYSGTSRGESSNNITHCFVDYNPLERDEIRPSWPAPRHLPPGFAGGAYDPNYSRSLTNDDPIY